MDALKSNLKVVANPLIGQIHEFVQNWVSEELV